MSRLFIVLCCFAAVACEKKGPPAPPVMTPPSGTVTINGTERIGWDQPAADAAELAAIGYALYLDNTLRMPLTGVACIPAASAGMFSCTAPLPTLSAGVHTLQLVSFTDDGSVLESERSGALVVNVVRLSSSANPAPAFESSTIITTDGVAMRVERVAAGFDRPTDLAFAPDGRLFVAEQGGTIRSVTRPAGASVSDAVPNAAVSIPDIAGTKTALLAVAIDPQFELTRFVFTVSVAPSRSGVPAFTLSRFREELNTFADRIVLLDEVRAASDPRAAMRFGPDGKLYVALDDGGDPRRRGDRASSNGKILRLNPDGTTPDDQVGASPMYAEGFGSPGGVDWHPRSGALWLADRDRGGAGLREVTQDPSARGRDRRGIVRDSYTLSSATPPSSIAFYRGGVFPAFTNTLLVASGEAQVLRVTEGKQRPPVQIPVGGVRAVAVSPEGAVYFATADAVGRLVADTR